MSAHSTSVGAPEGLGDGTRMGRHRVLGRLSEGAHAILYLGAHEITAAEVAIKVLRTALVRNPEMVARFDREARVMGRLGAAANVVHVHDAGVLDDGRRYLVMEFVRGRDLAAVIANGRRRNAAIEIDRIIAIASDLAAALRDAHRVGVVHRDIKPGNVMVVRLPDGTERAKLVDFGVSADLETRGTEGELTVHGSVLGTPEYMSPEQAVGLPAAIGMDVFSLGVLLFELLSGELPPVQQLRSGSVPRVSTRRDDVPRALDELVEGCLRIDPKLRVRDAIEVLSRLSTARDQRRAFSGPNKSAGGRPLRAAGAIEVDDREVVAARRERNLVAVDDRGSVDRSPPVVAAPSRARGARASSRSRPRATWLIAAIVLLGLGAGVTTWVVGRHRVASRQESGPAVAAELAAPRDTTSDGAADVAPPTEDAAPTVAPPPVVARAIEAEPKPEPKPKAAAEAPRPASPSKPPKPSADTPECAAARDEARAASDELAWKQVLEHTNTAACWPDRTARLRLRVEALVELARHDACIREGDGSRDPVVSDLVEHCRRRLAG